MYVSICVLKMSNTRSKSITITGKHSDMPNSNTYATEEAVSEFRIQFDKFLWLYLTNLIVLQQLNYQFVMKWKI